MSIHQETSIQETTYLELSEDDGASHKFYEVTVEGTQMTVRYGRIGDQGQVKTASFASADKARATSNRSSTCARSSTAAKTSDPLVPVLSALCRLQIVLFVGLRMKVGQEHQVKAEPPCVDGCGAPGLRVVE